MPDVMTVYQSNATLTQIAQRLQGARTIKLVCHEKPDGDALGAGLALTRAMTDRGFDAEFLLIGPVEENLRSLIGPTACRILPEDVAVGELDPPDTLLILDTGSWSQLHALRPWIEQVRDCAIVLDHHSHGDDVSALRYVDVDAASATQIVLSLFDHLGWEVSGGVHSVAEALFLGLATDTGWFRYDRAGAEVFDVAARLLRCGVDKIRLYQIIEESYPPQRLLIESCALQSLTYVCNNAAAVMSIRQSDIETTGASHDQLTGIVNLPMVVGSVRVSALLTEQRDGRTKMSFRSKPAMHGSNDRVIDVNVVAQEFGGGGHIHAAGAKSDMAIDETQANVIRALEAVFAR